MRITKARATGGFTIIETLIVMSILCFLIFGMSLGGFERLHRMGLDSESIAAGSIRATFALQRLSADIRKSAVATSPDAGSLTLRSPDGTAIRYFLRDDQLICERKSPQFRTSTSILGGVTSFAARADPSNPALISISIVTAQAPRIGRTRSRSYSFRVLSRLSPSL